MQVLILLFASGLALAAAAAGRVGRSDMNRPPEPPERGYGPDFGPDLENIVSTPAEVVAAYARELWGQSAGRKREEMFEFATQMLISADDPEWASILLPYGERPLPERSYLEHVADGIGVAFETSLTTAPVQWEGRSLLLVVFHQKFASLPDPMAITATTIRKIEAFVEAGGTGYRGYGRYEHRGYGHDRFGGGIVDLIVNSVVASAVGTVTSMGVQDLVNSAGGERRLARLVRHYKKAKGSGDESRARQITEKIAKSASRIKGRRVDWSEVEGLIAQQGEAAG